MLDNVPRRAQPAPDNGHSSETRLLVSFTERGEAVRIISARRATKRERNDYEENPLR